MTRYILITFGFLGAALYHMSGGEDFDPDAYYEARLATVEQEREAVELAMLDVTQANTLSVPMTGVGVVADVPASAIISIDSAKVAALAPQNGALEPAGSEQVASLGDEELIKAAIGEPDTVDAIESAALAVVPEIAPDIRYVTGNGVNMRTGPGTKYSVLARLTKGEEVLILQEPGNGWVKLKTIERGRIGWMADWLVEKHDQ